MSRTDVPRTIIRNCRLVSPGVDEIGAAIVIDGKHIADVVTNGAKIPGAENNFDASGLIAMPGFLDRHTHGAGGYDTTDADPAGIEVIAKRKLMEGVTSFLPTTLTLPEPGLAAAMENVARFSRRNSTGAKIPGVHL
ncbi:MAG: hypothetical protein JW808_00170, partial [Victivallales bacterium]|nr:hypothetical protein [Victivallales bacterium]